MPHVPEPGSQRQPVPRLQAEASRQAARKGRHADSQVRVWLRVYAEQAHVIGMAAGVSAVRTLADDGRISDRSATVIAHCHAGGEQHGPAEACGPFGVLVARALCGRAIHPRAGEVAGAVSRGAKGRIEMSKEFTMTSVSISGAPALEFRFAGDTCRASTAGAQLYCEMRGDGAIDMRLTDAAGEVLADLVVRQRPHRNASENLADVGSALLWSHWRHVEATRAAEASKAAP